MPIPSVLELQSKPTRATYRLLQRVHLVAAINHLRNPVTLPITLVEVNWVWLVRLQSSRGALLTAYGR